MRWFNAHFLSPLLIFFSFCSTAIAQNEASEFVIASGSKGGNYYKTGQLITTIFNKEKIHKFRYIESNGSLDNINYLKNNTADFAIIQRNILINGIYLPHTGMNKIEAIAPLFEEKLIFYAKGPENISIADLKKQCLKESFRFGFTDKQGYSYELYKTIFNYLGINRDHIEEHFSNYTDLIDNFKKDSLDVIVTFSAPLSELENHKSTNKIYFERSQIDMLSERIPNLYSTHFGTNSDHLTLGSWVFFVGSSDKVELVKQPELLFSKLYQDNNSTSLGSSIYNGIVELKNDKKRLDKYLSGLPLNQIMRSELDYKKQNFSWLWMLLLLFVIILLFLTRKKLFSKMNPLLIWHRFKHAVIGILILGSLYFICIGILYNSEKQFYEAIGVKSQLLNLTSKDLHAWVIIKISADIDNGIQPLSTLGKLMVSIITSMIRLGVLLIALTQIIVVQISKKRKKGLMDITFENHIIIIGWNDTAPDFVKRIISESIVYKGKSKKIVCITESPELVLDSHEELNALFLARKVHFVKGQSRDNQTMRKANLLKAETIILLAENSSKQSDERTLLRALAISRYCRKSTIENKTKVTKNEAYKTYDIGDFVDSSYVIAEINDPLLKNDLIEADVNEVILTSTYTKGVIIQSAFNHGISKVMDELFQYDSFNEIHTIELKARENAHLVGKTYDELLLPLRRNSILLLAIKVIYHDQNHRVIIDETKIQELLDRDELERQVIMNPITKAEIDRKTDNDDQLMVLFNDRTKLKSTIQEIRF